MLEKIDIRTDVNEKSCEVILGLTGTISLMQKSRLVGGFLSVHVLVVRRYAMFSLEIRFICNMLTNLQPLRPRPVAQ
ncbi:hypothetical protein ACE3NQ_11970 [Paenibacillus terreus]|uniref:Uncharacterized protein n=2 Tax=Paenibacillus terreus TaxID=1387834 RepID=A0ABV5B7M5_9BACL